MKIVGTDGMTQAEILEEVRRGAKFVIYQYCISALIVTFKRSSSVYFVRASESRVTKGLGFTATSFLAGWWGIPWGPIYTIQTIWRNLSGGHDVTQDLLARAQGAADAPIPTARG